MKKNLALFLCFLFLNTSCASVMTNFSEKKNIDTKDNVINKDFLNSEIKPSFELLENGLKITFNLQKNYSVKSQQIISFKRDVPLYWSLATIGLISGIMIFVPVTSNKQDLTTASLATFGTGIGLGLLDILISSALSEGTFINGEKNQEKEEINTLSYNAVTLKTEKKEYKSYTDKDGSVVFFVSPEELTNAIININNQIFSYRLKKEDVKEKNLLESIANNDFSTNIDLDIPHTNVINKDAVAVIIGNRDYKNKELPSVEFALSDAKLVKEYVKNVLGYKDKNIILVENALESDFNKIFGTKDDSLGTLSEYIEEGKSDVFIYYSGYSGNDLVTNNTYFLPIDYELSTISSTGYSLETFYKNLNAIKAKSITVILDSSISSNENLNIGNIDVLISSTGEQNSCLYIEKKHSLFTYYFLKALQLSDSYLSDENKVIDLLTLEDIYLYVNSNVNNKAKLLDNRDQTPQLFTKNRKKIFVKLNQ